MPGLTIVRVGAYRAGRTTRAEALAVLIDDKTNDRWRGAYLGLAVSEALGAAVEFISLAGQYQIEPVVTRLVTWSGALS